MAAGSVTAHSSVGIELEAGRNGTLYCCCRCPASCCCGQDGINRHVVQTLPFVPICQIHGQKAGNLTKANEGNEGERTLAMDGLL